MADVESSHDSIHAQLERILSSPGFARNQRISSLLAYIVRKHLEGKPEQLKETVIGVELFGRKPDYDPHRDSVVRTEAAKLRARLLEYYASAGAADPVTIEIPKGRYRPVVRFSTPALQPNGKLRGWAGAVAAAVVLLVGVVAYWTSRQARVGGVPGGPRSVAVLPFVNLSSDASNEYFSDGLTDEIINALTKVEGLRVPARGSAFSFKGKRVDVREIGAKLHTEMVLEGTVRKYGENVRITTALSKVADGYHVWSETYDRDIKDVLAIQNEIAQAIVAALQLKLDVATNPGRQTTDPQAYNLYLKGRYFQHQGAGAFEAQKLAVAHFQNAIQKDPNYAAAYAGLADAWHAIGLHDPSQPRRAFLNAESAAKKALEIDSTLSDAHVSMANVRLAKWDWDGAESEFRRAIQLNPHNARARLQYATSCLALTDRWEQALEEAERAQALDLVSPEVHGQFATLLHCARQYDRAIDLARKAVEMNPKALGAQNTLGRSYTQKGMLAEAIAEFEKAERFGGRRSHWAASLVKLYVNSGRRTEAEKLVAMWKQRPHQEFGHAESMAMVYAGLGNTDEAFRWLEQAFQEQWIRLPWIKVAPEYDALRSDPRFQVLVKKMGL
jgi:serine/threonine-protein kinase